MFNGAELYRLLETDYRLFDCRRVGGATYVHTCLLSQGFNWPTIKVTISR